MAQHTVIIHGWSDCSASFVDIKRFLISNGIGNVDTIYYADYESREDNLTFEDVIDGLNDQFHTRGLIDAEGNGNLDVIVHSTGGLVIRHWIARYYGHQPEKCPIKNLIMLAPANFGSPLARRGKSFLGSLVKGRWQVGDLFEAGRQLLDGLEIASPYQWTLAEKDLLTADRYYDHDRIRLTILVGLDDYQGLRGWVNKPGTDGTVVIAGTTLNSLKATLDFSNPNAPLNWKTETEVGNFAFGVLAGYNHGSIVGAFADFATHPQSSVLQYTLQALRIQDDAKFEVHRRTLDQETDKSYQVRPVPRYQQFIVHAIDDQAVSIRDFTIEFAVRRVDPSGVAGDEDVELSQQVHEALTPEFYTNSVDSSHRRFLVDIAQVKNMIPGGHRLYMSLYVPSIDKGIRYDTDNIQQVMIYDPAGGSDLRKLFYLNTTTLMELVVNRKNEYVLVGTEPKKH